MERTEMCGEEIVRLASSRRNGSSTKRVPPGDALHKLIQAALAADEPFVSTDKSNPGFYFG